MTTPFMPGFDPKWREIPDYILGITKQIWEDREIHTLHHTYGPDLIVRSPASVVVGNAGIIAATQSTLAEFPDRALLGEDVIYTHRCGQFPVITPPAVHRNPHPLTCPPRLPHS